MAAINLYNDIEDRRLVLGLNRDEVKPFSEFYQGEVLNIRVYPVEPTRSQSPPYFTKADISNMTLKMLMGPRAGSTDYLATQFTWTRVIESGNQGYFDADFSLNTTDIDTALGTGATHETYFEIITTLDAIARTSLQIPVRINATAYDPTGAAPAPAEAAQFYTKSEAEAVFVKWIGNPNGAMLSLKSPDGNKERFLGLDNTGNPLDYSI